MKKPALFIVLVLVSALLSGKLYAQVTYTLSGTVSNLAGDGLELRSSTGETLSVSAGDTSFTFSTGVPAGTYTGFTVGNDEDFDSDCACLPQGIFTKDYSYWVKVSSHPTGQACTVTTNGAGKMPSNNVDGILVECKGAYNFDACDQNDDLYGLGKCSTSWLNESPSASMSCTADVCICQTESTDFSGTSIDGSEGYVFDRGQDNISGSYKIQECNVLVSYCAENQYVDSGLGSCVPCAAGTTRPAGDDPKGPSTVCEVTYCAADQYVSGNACLACPAGTTNVAGDDAYGGDTSCDTPNPLIYADGFENQ